MPKISKFINQTFDKYIIDLVDHLYPVIRSRKYSNSYLLSMFKHLLHTVSNWKSLSHLKDYSSYSDRPYHYKYLNQIFNKWSADNVFKNAYSNMLKDHYFRLKHVKKSKNINLYIDSSFVINLYGKSDIATNPEYRKKRVTKISVLSDEKKNVLALSLCKVHLTTNNKCAFKHDVKTVQSTLNDMSLIIPKKYTVKIGGDKGYITRKRFRLNNNKRVPIIATKRKNQKKQNTIREKRYLKKRNIVETTIASIKRNNRLMVRKDKESKNYIGFVYLAMIDNFYKRNM
jgi:hypothetical protein